MITEEEFSQQVEDLLNIFGWRWCHFRPARTLQGWRTAITGDKGFPDIVAVRWTRLIFAELKSEKGTVSKEQQQWLDELADGGKVELYLWRPAQIEEIAEILR